MTGKKVKIFMLFLLPLVALAAFVGSLMGLKYAEALAFTGWVLIIGDFVLYQLWKSRGEI